MNVSDNRDGDGIEIREVGLRPGEKLFEELLISGDELKTKNKKIFKSIENFLCDDDLIIVLDNLQMCINKDDIDGLRDIIIENVEGYKAQAEPKKLL